MIEDHSHFRGGVKRRKRRFVSIASEKRDLGATERGPGSLLFVDSMLMARAWPDRDSIWLYVSSLRFGEVSETACR